MSSTLKSDNELKQYCRQLQNMFDFLLLSMKAECNIPQQDIYYFLQAMNVVMMKICKKLEK